MKISKKIKTFFNKISLVDKWLIIIMIILFVQTCHNLFANEIISKDTNNIDIIVRTSAAAIFGYFLSGNFLKVKNKNNIMLPSDCEDSHLEKNHKASFICNKHQIYIIATIGVVSLLILLSARNFVALNDTATATISQLRDFVSAMVGFLISCGKSHSEN